MADERPRSRGQAASPGRPGRSAAGDTRDAAAGARDAAGDTPDAAAGARDAADGDRELAPAGVRLVPDSGTRLVAGGSVLVGGSPVRVLRLTRAGARQVAAWFAGTPVPSGASARRLARRLLDAGIAQPDFAVRGEAGGRPGTDAARSAGEAVPAGEARSAGEAQSDGGARSVGEGVPAGEAVPAAGPVEVKPAAGVARCPSPADVTVVIPVRDRHAELARCLSGLRDLPHVIVVDDASADPLAISRIAAGHGAAVIRRPVNGGPGAARNTGLGAVETDIVAFLDSDCVPRPGWLDGLLPHFTDPAVGAVAPRIVPHEKGAGWLARYEGASSSLDMGARPSPVRPGARVSYVPGAALVVRKAAAGAGFRDGMYVGEDVDFVWRTSASGWRVRYEPGAVMGHDHRVTFRAWFSRRADYGTSVAPLEELHQGAVRPLYASWWTAGAWAAALAGRPVTAAALTATATALLARRLSRVTGERWPFPDPQADNSNKHAVAPRAVGPPDNSSRHPVAPPDNSKKGSWEARVGAIVDVWAHSRVPKRPLSAPSRASAPTPQPASSSLTASSPLPAPTPQPASSSLSAPLPPFPTLPPSATLPPFATFPPSAPAPDNSKRRSRAAPPWEGAAWQLAARLAGGGTVAAARPLGSAVSRTWWPVVIPVALAVRKLRLPVAALILVPPLLDWADRRPPLDPARYVAARLLDDAAYSLGVWQGCLARRTLRPLLPVIGARRQPGSPVLSGRRQLDGVRTRAGRRRPVVG